MERNREMAFSSAKIIGCRSSHISLLLPFASQMLLRLSKLESPRFECPLLHDKKKSSKKHNVSSLYYFKTLGEKLKNSGKSIR